MTSEGEKIKRRLPELGTAPIELVKIDFKIIIFFLNGAF